MVENTTDELIARSQALAADARDAVEVLAASLERLRNNLAVGEAMTQTPSSDENARRGLAYPTGSVAPR